MNKDSIPNIPAINTPLIKPILKLTSSLALASFLLIPSAQASESGLAPQIGSIREAKPQSLSSTTAGGQKQESAITATARTFFRPPSNPRPRSGSQTTMGTRQGVCLADAGTSLAALGPSSVSGRTTSTHPSLTWYLPPAQTPLVVQLRLLAPDEFGIPVAIHTAHLEYASGYNLYQIPDDAPALVDGVEYRWQVIVVCDPGSPSRSVGQELSIEKIAASPSLTQALSASANAAQRALSYGEAGVWYDAIAAVAQAQTTAEKTIRTGLLQDLAEAENEQENAQTDFLADLLEIAGVSASYD